MDIIFIRELRLPAWIGLYKHEKVAQQMIELDIEMGVPNTAVYETGKVRDTIDYGVVTEKIKVVLNNERFGLVESLADRIAKLLIDDFHSPKVTVSATKLGVLKDAKRVGVRVQRTRE
ncbi:MAG: dihydroneopterin aldolase [Burkholderiales bacterium]